MHKNWGMICLVGDPWLRMALGLINLETEEGQMLVEALPQYFCEERGSEWPIPWSILKREVDHAHLHELTDVVEGHNIPTIHFCGYGERPTEVLPEAPKEFEFSSEGDVKEYMGSLMVVIENGSHLVLAPFERIVMDL
ncbi:hypothetical protein CO172_03070 [Candidatus Uhrbacteria bacterium CG_4_9_14_3_um_filter_36_7]|uniref:Uncharacterized protein n=1 Tax=Candidatus Uhrbacteria bacterium CG_4_9_14_3_um_filter_36_7 TaxID=1975033 RepID=A0A2M7XGX2_9BACT|nr:MAG: hypothetical protein CO172_03070 [Candidatus Uhrbacteria bacterium CG_4_9_14_3_um_filter_36_7]